MSTIVVACMCAYCTSIFVCVCVLLHIHTCEDIVISAGKLSSIGVHIEHILRWSGARWNCHSVEEQSEMRCQLLESKLRKREREGRRRERETEREGEKQLAHCKLSRSLS